MSFYADLKADLSALFLDPEGPFLDATITRATPGVYDPATRRVAGTQTTSLPCRASIDTIHIAGQDGTRTSMTTVLCNIPLTVGDTISINLTTYRVTEVYADNNSGVFEAEVTR